MTKAMIELATKIENALMEKGVYADVYPEYDDLNREFIKIDISWGDWKHDHLRAKWVVEDVLGLTVKKWDEYVTEENGSDCYSASHSVWFGNVIDHDVVVLTEVK